MSIESLQKAVDLAGGQSALAEAVRALVDGSKISQAHVWKWLNLAACEVPPAEYVIPICDALSWRITPHELRPDLYPHPSDGMPKVSPAVTAAEREAA